MRCLVLGARLAASLFVLALALPATAQEFRGSITGKISDSSGAILPGVTITATNVDTGGKTTAVTNGEGVYFIPFLQPGKYTVSAELMGFKSVKRDDVEVRIGDKLSIDLALPIGQREEVITVEAVSPLLEVTSASQGQVIDEKRISLLPLSDGNPFTLARIVPGVAYTGDLKFSRPFDNAGTSGIVADGSTGGAEFTLDGSPNMTSGRRVAFVPPAGAVSEFKVETATFDAQQGHTAGANVNVTIKSGTNLVKGEGYWYYRDDKLSKNDFFLIRGNQPKAALGYDRFGGHAGGPVKKNRTFVFGAIEWLYDEFPEPGQFTVPTAKMRNGDLSELLPAGIIIYDPTTAVRRADGRIERQPFPGNIIPPEKISAISREFMKYYPLPNQAGTAQQQNNYISSNPRTDDFYSISLRGDHRITDQQNLFVRYTRNDRTEARGAWAGEVNGLRPIGNYLYRINDGVTVDHVWSLSPSALLNVRGGWQRFQEPNVRQHEGQFDTASLGFPASTTALFVDSDYLPRFTIDGMTSIGENKGGTTFHSIYSFQPTYTKVSGNHTFRAGYDYRLYKEPGFGTGAAAGQYDFASNYTRQLDNSSAAVTGQQFAAFLLGQPTGGTIDRNANRLNYSPYQGLWFQDDWKISSKLSLNLGLRYEYEGATYESENRNVRGFDPAATLAITSAAQAAYAAAPIPEIPAANFRVLGGLQFADSNNRGFWNADKNNWAPRLGLAYRLNDRTVVRGGLGVYTVPFIISGVTQPGFSQSTPLLPSNDVGLTFQANLANPFPNGVQEPAGSSAGPNTFLGRGVGRLALVDGVSNARNARWALTVQRELPGSWLVEVGYVGSKGWDQTVDVTLNAIPAQYLSTSRVRDDATNNLLTQQVTNPFRGLIPGTNHNNNTIARSQLLRPFPQFTDVTSWNYNGSTIYHSMQSRVERRFTQGYTLLFAYTYSQFKERVSYLNPTDAELEERLADADVPHRFSFSGIYELPFGQGKKFGTDAGKLLNGIIGDWTVTAIVQIQSGRPLGLNNAYFNGDPSGLKTHYSKNVDEPVFDLSGFYFHDAAVQTNGVDDPVKQRNDPRINLVSNIRYFPSRMGNLRSQALNEWQLSFVKRVHISRTLRGQFNLELLNAFNQTIYSAPNTDPRNANFGKVTQQFNLPGSMQIAFKLLF